MREARERREEVNIGRIFGICVEKGSELPDGDPDRKFKGRAVFQGNNVWNQNWEWAVFGELGSNPATMQATQVCDCYGLLPGHKTEQADARQAYTQTVLGGVKTWVELPRDQWPEKWARVGLTRPVCRLWRALYGHPDSGGVLGTALQRKAG